MFTTINSLLDYRLDSIAVKVVKNRNQLFTSGGMVTFLTTNDFLFLKVKIEGLNKYQKIS